MPRKFIYLFCTCICILLSIQGIHQVDGLRSEAELSDTCFGFPTEDSFNRLNCIRCLYGASPHFYLTVGDEAIDFTLHDLNGDHHSLSTLLKEKPVVLIWGMYTCPGYQGLGDYLDRSPFDQNSFVDEYDIVEEYHDRVNFVHLYGPEPHPTAPDSNFDDGTYRIMYWSVVRQANTYDDRIQMAKRIQPNIHPEALLLPDYLPGNPYEGRTNSVWCSYASGARTSMLIGMDGTVKYHEDWFHKTNLSDAIEALLAGREIAFQVKENAKPKKGKGRGKEHKPNI